MIDEAERSKLTRRAALASVGVALVLLLLKGHASLTTGSVALLASLVDTFLDVVASLITLLAVRVAAAPADREHRFGHGKAEAVAALVQVGIIFVSALAIAWRAVQRLIAGSETGQPEYGILVSLIAILLTFALIAFQRSVVRRTGSVAIAADRIHYQSDLLLNLAVIAALLLDHQVGLTGADALFGMAISLWLIFGAWRASLHALDQLMDKEWPEDRRLRLVEIAAAHPAGRGLHDLRTRSSGARDFAQFHLWIDPEMNVRDAHQVVEEIEAAIEAEFPGTEILIHLDPEGQVDQPGNLLAEQDETRKLR